MLKSILANLGITGLAQGISLGAMLLFAAQMDTHSFAQFAITLSAATIGAALLSLQIERCYVRVSADGIAAFAASHLAIILILCGVAAPFLLKIPHGLQAGFLAFAIACNQVASYYAARIGAMKRIWWMKALQALTLAIGTALALATDNLGSVAFLFSLSWLIPAVAALDRQIWRALPRQRLRHLVDCLRQSHKVARAALPAMLCFNAVREGPVLIAGLLADPAAAAAIGLANRVIGQPLGLLGKSTSLVLAKLAASGTAAAKVPVIMIGLAVSAMAYIAACALLASHWPLLAPYALLVPAALALAPMYTAHLAIGAIGPYLVAQNLYAREMWVYAAQAAFCAAIGAYLWNFGGSITPALWALSAVVAITSLPFVIMILRHAKAGPMTQKLRDEPCPTI